MNNYHDRYTVYHSPEWANLVSLGFVTHTVTTVDNAEIAHMIAPGRACYFSRRGE